MSGFFFFGLIICDALLTLLNSLSFSARVKNLQVDLVGQLVLQIQGNQWAPGDKDNILRFTFFERQPCINGSLFSLKVLIDTLCYLTGAP